LTEQQCKEDIRGEMSNSSSSDKHSMLQSNATKPSSSGNGLPTGVLVGIVIACLFFIALFSIATFLLYRRIQRRRKNHGEYRPQQEEAIHGKELPALTPPNPPQIDGLI